MDWKEGITRKPKYWPFFLFFLFFLSSSAQVIDSWVTWLYLATLQILHPPNGSPAPVFESDGTRCHHAITLATLGTFIANWKNLLSAAHSVWWLEHTFHHSTVWPFKDTSISNLKTKQAVWGYYGSGLVNRGTTNRISAFCLCIIISVGSVSLCQFAIS